MMTKTNSTITAPAYTITCTAATNSAPSSKYSTASDAMTTTSESALLMGCVCASKFTAPATQIAPKTRKSTRCSIVLNFKARWNSHRAYVQLRPVCDDQGGHYQIRD